MVGFQAKKEVPDFLPRITPTFRQHTLSTTRPTPMLFNTREMITVRHLVQWSNCHEYLGRLKTSDEYPRRETAPSPERAGRFILKVLNNTDEELLVLNMKLTDANIVDGAARVATLVKFQEGQIPMVVPFGQLPDNVSWRAHGVPEEKYKFARFKPDNETLVEAFYHDMEPAVQQKFLDSHVTVLKLEDLSDADEAHLHFELNGVRPQSPSYASGYNEAEELQKVCSRLFANDAEHLRTTMGYISGVLAPVARCEVLRLITKVLDNADEAAEGRESGTSPRAGKRIRGE
jgi:hypothetical protein